MYILRNFYEIGPWSVFPNLFHHEEHFLQMFLFILKEIERVNMFPPGTLPLLLSLSPVIYSRPFGNIPTIAF